MVQLGRKSVNERGLGADFNYTDNEYNDRWNCNYDYRHYLKEKGYY